MIFPGKNCSFAPQAGRFGDVLGCPTCIGSIFWGGSASKHAKARLHPSLKWQGSKVFIRSSSIFVQHSLLGGAFRTTSLYRQIDALHGSTQTWSFSYTQELW
jgi:hypothetical protein